MKLSYSILLGEHVESSTVTHGDCARWQLTCPSCNEPIFKVERPTNTLTQHFFAHYNRDKSYNEECELRVAAITKTQIEQNQLTARNQKLKYFLSVLDYWILETHRKQFTTKLSDHHAAVLIDIGVEHIINSPSLTYFGELLYNDARSQRKTQTLYEYIDECLETAIEIELTPYGEETLPTDFTIVTRRRIASDIFIHLLTGKARSSFNYLFSHAYFKVRQYYKRIVTLYERYESLDTKEPEFLRRMKANKDSTNSDSTNKMDPQMKEYAKAVVLHMEEAIGKSRKHTRTLLSQLDLLQKPSVMDSSDPELTPLYMMLRILTGTMFQLLLSLPIERMLEHAKNKITAPTQHELGARQLREFNAVERSLTQRRFAASDITGQET